MPSCVKFIRLNRRCLNLNALAELSGGNNARFARLLQTSSITLKQQSHPVVESSSASSLQTNLVNSIQHNVNWINQQYDRFFGIAEIRAIQNRVLEAESEFVSITQNRKLCQDQIESIKEQIKGIRDKLEITPRQSDNYLRLITEEHKLLREQLAFDVRLTQLKEKEQLYLDNLSKLLRQSHELERLRQERAKYWQIISISLSIAGSLVALIAQRARSQKSIMNQMAAFDHKLGDIEQSLQDNMAQLNSLRRSVDQLAMSFNERKQVQLFKLNNQRENESSTWWFWIPGWASISSLKGYLF